MGIVYLDASALVKLVFSEPESDSLHAHLSNENECVTSLLGRIELERTARLKLKDAPEKVPPLVHSLLINMTLIPLDVATAAVASIVKPNSLRSLDAIHLATMIALESELDHCCCYDSRLTAACEGRRIKVVAPR